MGRSRSGVVVGAVAASLLLGACQSGSTSSGSSPSGSAASTPPDGAASPDEPVTLAFAGDVHFEDELATPVDRPGSTLGPLSQELGDADVAVVNLETALALEDRPARKELEDPTNRYWFRTPPRALELLGRSGVDVAAIANNHGADHGRAGLREALAASGRGGVTLVGAGRGAAALTPYRTSVRGTDVAVLAADASPRESAAPVWAAGEDGGVGLASARGPGVARLVEAVRESARADDVTVVYLHWGAEGEVAPTAGQRRLATRLARAGADVVVGAHSHVLQGAGVLDGAYVAYGLGNFAWYNSRRTETGVLTLEVDPDGEVLGDTWTPGRIGDGGGLPQRLGGPQATAAVTQWRRLRDGTGLQAPPGAAEPELPAYAAQVSRIGPDVRDRMLGVSHRPAQCPVPLDRLRHLELSYVGFDGEAHTGELVVAAGVADDVVDIFGELYAARFPLRQLRLVDDFGGDDDRSMAANNSSGYNCRPVAGTDRFSDHAFGRAIDLNPVQNPYVTGAGILPPAGTPFAAVDRAVGAQPAAGALHAGDVVVRAFTSRGWTWGGVWSEPDYQHFSAP